MDTRFKNPLCSRRQMHKFPYFTFLKVLLHQVKNLTFSKDKTQLQVGDHEIVLQKLSPDACWCHTILPKPNTCYMLMYRWYNVSGWILRRLTNIKHVLTKPGGVLCFWTENPVLWYLQWRREGAGGKVFITPTWISLHLMAHTANGGIFFGDTKCIIGNCCHMWSRILELWCPTF